jgi:hypothetical protein
MEAKEVDQKLLAAKEAAGGGELLVVETDIEGAEVLGFRVSTPAEWKRYRTESSDTNPNVKVAGASNLVHACNVYPGPDLFARLVEAHPGLVETCLGDLIEHCGAARAKKVRKL